MEIKTLTLFLAAALLFCACGDKKPAANELVIDNDNLPVQEFMDRTTMSLTEKNKKLWTLKTSHLVKFRKGGHIYLNPVEIIYFTPQGESHLRSDSGHISSAFDTLIATGNVKISTYDGKQVTTSAISWHKKTDKVFSDRLVEMMTSEGDIYTGTGFTANTNLSEWRILHNVKAKINDMNAPIR
ncbi:MAG: LPS export ABC transporter periplasmic protein LptC [Fibrobacterota bacterium]